MASLEHDLLQVFLRSRQELRRYLLRRVQCSEAAADLLQETYLRLADYPAGDEIKNWHAFMFRVADNLALDHLRSRMRQQQRYVGQPEEDIVCVKPGPDRVLAARQQMDRFETLIHALPPQCRSVFLLCRVEGRSYAEVAEELGISVRTVESHMRKALSRLQADADSIT
ncbi:RNA polymerase sigma factor [Methylosarcina fibrata]|uniref:RNA polymerase sigma factor n=1 Tax=Methylosarcina fibrata TaxID=105972 RepID=UPI000525F446|nr:RNA polymerase sigma factor [Methylosarcina fibrata]